MNVAVSCDSIISRNWETAIIEALVDLYPESELYTLAHRPGAVLGSLEQRKIHSTYLSHSQMNEEEFREKRYLYPGAAKNLSIPCRWKKVINIGNGSSLGFGHCEKSQLIHYLIDWNYGQRPKGIWNKLFGAYVDSYWLKSLKRSDKVLVSTLEYKNRLADLGVQATVLVPPFKTQDFPVIKAPIFTYDHVAVYAVGLVPGLASELRQYFQNRGIKFKFFGPDQHLSTIKNGPEDSHFFGDRCSGELAPLLSGSRCVIDWSGASFPIGALQGLSSGRPVISDSITMKFFSENTGLVKCDPSIKSLDECLGKLNNEHFDSQLLHAHAAAYDERRFKKKIKSLIESD